MPTQTGSIDLSSQKKAHDEAAKVATNYISVDSTGLMVADGDGSETPSTATTRNVFIDSDSVDIRDGQESRASFGETVRLGKEYVSGATDNEAHAEFDFHSMQLFDKEGTDYFSVGDLRNQSGIASISETFTGDGTKKTFSLEYYAYTTSYTVTVNGTAASPTKTPTSFTFATAPAAGDSIVVEYTTNRPVMAFVFGTHTGTKGAFSVSTGYNTSAGGVAAHAGGYMAAAAGYAAHAEGDRTTASGDASHAEGYNTTASGNYSHAEGDGTTASGIYSHAEGDGTSASGWCSHAEGKSANASGSWSHAEGDETTASGKYSHAEGKSANAGGSWSHAEGLETSATGMASHAQNERTIAKGTSQTALGKYNVEDFTSAVIVGNGTADDARSNALTIDWGGNVEAAGKVEASEVKASGEVKAGGSTPLVPIGTILDFAAATPPTGYLKCNGQAVSRTDYAALFAVIGTTWGAGDGSTTFNLPDFRGRTSIGAGTGTATDATAHALASSGGSEGVTLTANESGTHSHGHGMTQPAFTVGKHQHQILNSAVMYNNGSSVTTRMATSGGGTKISLNTNLGYKTLDSDAFAATRTTNAAVTDHAGADATAAHNNMAPFATVTKIIRAL